MLACLLCQHTKHAHPLVSPLNTNRHKFHATALPAPVSQRGLLAAGLRPRLPLACVAAAVPCRPLPAGAAADAAFAGCWCAAPAAAAGCGAACWAAAAAGAGLAGATADPVPAAGPAAADLPQLLLLLLLLLLKSSLRLLPGLSGCQALAGSVSGVVKASRRVKNDLQLGSRRRVRVTSSTSCAYVQAMVRTSLHCLAAAGCARHHLLQPVSQSGQLLRRRSHHAMSAVAACHSCPVPGSGHSQSGGAPAAERQ